MSIKASSVTDMMQKLGKKGLVNYKAYRGVALTEDGRKLALDVLRRHRIWETFLVSTLKFRWDEVHELAEELEHVASAELIRKLDAFLGHPKYDPHGDPIPTENGAIEDDRDPVPLADLKTGNIGRLVGVRDDSSDFLKYCEHANLLLGSRVEVLKVVPYDRTMVLQLAVREMTISEKAAGNLMIQVLH